MSWQRAIKWLLKKKHLRTAAVISLSLATSICRTPSGTGFYFSFYEGNMLLFPLRSISTIRLSSTHYADEQVPGWGSGILWRHRLPSESIGQRRLAAEKVTGVGGAGYIKWQLPGNIIAPFRRKIISDLMVFTWLLNRRFSWYYPLGKSLWIDDYKIF
jgi:hypothetical protein